MVYYIIVGKKSKFLLVSAETSLSIVHGPLKSTARAIGTLLSCLYADLYPEGEQISENCCIFGAKNGITFDRNITVMSSSRGRGETKFVFAPYSPTP